MTFKTQQQIGASGCLVGSCLGFMFLSELHLTIVPRQKPQMLKLFEIEACWDVWRLRLIRIMFQTFRLRVCGWAEWWDWFLVKACLISTSRLRLI